MKSRIRLFRSGSLALVRRAATDLSPGDGWASVALQESMSRAALVAIGVWQFVVLWAAASSAISFEDKTLLLIAHLALVGASYLTWLGRFAPSILLIAAYLLVVLDWLKLDSVEGALFFAAVWSTNVLAAASAFALAGRAALLIPIVMAFVLPPALFMANPSLGGAFPVAVGTTTLAIVAATRFGILFIRDFAKDADEQSVAAETQIRSAAKARAASRESAEEARILHDTVINTLGAIANGGAAIEDLDLVRQRCAKDAETVQALESAGASVLTRGDRFLDIFSGGLQVIERSGLTDDELAEAEQQLTTEVVSKLVRAVRETLLNAHKHASAKRVSVEIKLEDHELQIVVSDDGIGFDQVVETDRGIENSVRARLAEINGSVHYVSEPGNGTTVTFSRQLDLLPLSSLPQAQRNAELGGEEAVSVLRTWAGWFWAYGVVAVGFVIEPMNRFGELTHTYSMLLLLTALTTFAWFSRGEGGGLSTSASTLLVLSAPATFVLGAAAVDFGRDGGAYWQALAPSGPLVLLLALSQTSRPVRTASTLLAAAALVMVFMVWPTSPGAAFIIPVAAVIPLGMMTVWGVFQYAIREIAEQSLSDRRTELRARLEVDVRAAADEARRQWAARGLWESAALLRSIADGSSDPQDHSTRAYCAREEVYLRQLTQLNPDLVRLSPWISQALTTARAQGADVSVRTGELDAPSAESAELLGQAMIRTIEALPASGSLKLSVFPASEGLCLTIVGPEAAVTRGQLGLDAKAVESSRYQQLADLGLFEIVVSLPKDDLPRVTS